MLRITSIAEIYENRARRASMRPQRNAADNLRVASDDFCYTVASMRPQRNAADNP